MADAFTIDFDALPHDEIEARQYLQEGLIDSLLWSAMQPFYRKALSVPAGELSYLKPLFPAQSESFPDDPECLAAYQPWNLEAVERFFRDYPLLTVFSPILLFDYHPRFADGEVALHMNRRGYDTAAVHHSRFSYRHERYFSVQGTADISSSAARWERRVLKWSPVASIDLQCGNVTLLSDDGLAYGYFPESFEGESAVTDNWFYGDAPMWNGVSLNVSPSRMFNGTAFDGSTFMHRRLTEKIVGGSFSAKREGFKVAFATSHAEYAGESGGDLFLHGGADFKWAGGYVKLASALNYRFAGRIPLSARAGIIGANGRSEITVFHIPARFYAPRSTLLRRSLRELESGDTLFSDATWVRVKSVRRTLSRMRFSSGFDLWFRDSDVFQGKVVVACNGKWENIRTRMQLIHKITDEHDDNGSGSVVGGIDLYCTSWIRFHTNGRFHYRQFAYSSMYAVIEPELLLQPHITLRPYFSLRYDNSGMLRLGYGISQQLTLFDRTTTTFSLRMAELEEGRELFMDAKAVLYF